MLRLLAQRGEQGYEDLAALMGISVDEVHAQGARRPRRSSRRKGSPRPAIPPPPAAEPRPRPRRQLPSRRRRRSQSAEPAAAERRHPRQPRRRRRQAAPPSPRPAAAPAPKHLAARGGGARAAIAAGALVLVALVAGARARRRRRLRRRPPVGDGSDRLRTGDQHRQRQRPKLTQAILEPVDGGDAKGVAIFGRVKNSLALQVEAKAWSRPARASPTRSGSTSRRGKCCRWPRPGSARTARSRAQVEVPTEVLGLPRQRNLRPDRHLAAPTDATLKASLAKATRERKAPIYTGTDVLRGAITRPDHRRGARKAASSSGPGAACPGS